MSWVWFPAWAPWGFLRGAKSDEEKRSGLCTLVHIHCGVTIKYCKSPRNSRLKIFFKDNIEPWTSWHLLLQMTTEPATNLLIFNPHKDDPPAISNKETSKIKCPYSLFLPSCFKCCKRAHNNLLSLHCPKKVKFFFTQPQMSISRYVRGCAEIQPRWPWEIFVLDVLEVGQVRADLWKVRKS